MSLWFKNAALQNEITEEDEIKDIIEHNTMVFGFIQILCFVWAVPIGKYLLHPNFPLSDKPRFCFGSKIAGVQTGPKTCAKTCGQ